MPPPGHEPFLRAICADPEDDTVRLVYADWLDENGDPDRAEFIRLQVAQVGVPRSYGSPHFRSESLRQQHCERWLAELPVLKGIIWDDAFRRGFVDAVRVQAGRWLLTHRDVIFATAPVQSLTVYDAGEGTLAKVLKLSELERLTELYLARCRVSPNRLGALARCPALKRLRTLGIRGRELPDRTDLTEDEARELTETPHLPALEEVYFQGPISAGAAELLRSRYKTVRYRGSRS